MKAQSNAKKRRLAALNEHHGSSGVGGARTAGAPQAPLTRRQQQQQPAAADAAAAAAPAPQIGQQASAVAARQAAAAAAKAAAPGAAAPQAAAQRVLQPTRSSRAATPPPAAAPSDAPALGAFPYNPLPADLASSHLAAAMLLPAPAPAGAAPGAAAGGGAGRGARGGVEDLLEALMLPHMAPSAASAMLASRLGPDKAVLLDNPTAKLVLTRPGAAARGRARLMAGRLLPRRRRAELTSMPASGLDGPAVLAMHGLWSNYAEQLLLAGRNDPRRALQGADWHGAALRVSAHRNPTYLGRGGVVAKATANALVLVSPEGRASTVPIKGATFEGVAPGLSAPFTLAGSSLATLQCSLQDEDGGGGG